MTTESTPEHVILEIRHRISDEGRYGDVFALGDGRVAKLFKRKPHDPDGHAVRAVYYAEVAGFRKAHEHPELRRFVAAFFGPLIADQVLDDAKRDVLDEYWPDCCYALEFLEGTARKVCAVPESVFPFVERLLAKFTAAGITYTADASAFGWESPDTLKLVDIASYDRAADYPKSLFGPDAP